MVGRIARPLIYLRDSSTFTVPMMLFFLGHSTSIKGIATMGNKG
jgi:hypothetical protein